MAEDYAPVEQTVQQSLPRFALHRNHSTSHIEGGCYPQQSSSLSQEVITGSAAIKNKTIKLSARDQPYLDDELIKAQSDFQGNRVVPIALSTMSNPTPAKEKEAALNFLYKAVPTLTNSPSKSKFAAEQSPTQQL